MRIPKLVWIMSTVLLSRLSLNTAQRFAYPFAPALSRGMGVPLTAITALIAVNQATSILSIFLAPIGDHIGYRVMMLTGLVMLTAGMFGGACLPFYGVMLIVFFLAGLGKAIFDPALLAYIGGRVPFEQRGLMTGIAEFSWAGSSLIGIPLIGLLIARLGWRSPFFALGGTVLIGMIGLGSLLPQNEKKTARTQYAAINFQQLWRRMLQERAAMSTLGYSFFISTANTNLFAIYGAWLEHTFSLSIVAIGFSTSVIGLAELSGEGLTAFLADRLGLKRSLILGLTLSGLSYLVLPVLAHSLPLALIALFLIFVTVEFTIVTLLSFCTEILPDARATMMASTLAFCGIGRVCGTFIGGKLWMTKQIIVIGLVSAFMSALALIVLLWGLRNWKPDN